MQKIHHDRSGGMGILAVKEREIDGRHSDQPYRQNAEHFISLTERT
jgi:hypothetical protein